MVIKIYKALSRSSTLLPIAALGGDGAQAGHSALSTNDTGRSVRSGVAAQGHALVRS